MVAVTNTVTNLQEVRVVEQIPYEVIKPMEIEKIVNHIVEVPKIVEITKEVPIYITTTKEKPVEVVETIEKIVAVENTVEKMVPVEIKVQVPCVKEVQRDITHTEYVKVKGERQEVVKDVERVVTQELIREVLVPKEVLIEKEVPVYITTERPVIVQVDHPYIQYEPQLIHHEIEKLIPFR